VPAMPAVKLPYYAGSAYATHPVSVGVEILAQWTYHRDLGVQSIGLRKRNPLDELHDHDSAQKRVDKCSERSVHRRRTAVVKCGL
jgi:hypothetical protein